MLTEEKINQLLSELNQRLHKEQIVGEVYLVGGAVMCLVYHARPATKDVDGYFLPKEKLRECAAKIAEAHDLPENWLNDAAKGYLSNNLSNNGKFNTWLELENLKVFVPAPEYLLALKCLAMRIGLEFHDEEDIRFLLRYLNIEKYEEAVKIIKEFYPIEKFPQKTLYALEEILNDKPK